jgi:hypothetical protein
VEDGEGTKGGGGWGVGDWARKDEAAGVDKARHRTYACGLCAPTAWLLEGEPRDEPEFAGAARAVYQQYSYLGYKRMRTCMVWLGCPPLSSPWPRKRRPATTALRTRCSASFVGRAKSVTMVGAWWSSCS